MINRARESGVSGQLKTLGLGSLFLRNSHLSFFGFHRISAFSSEIF
jgi:hypothetical protein